MTFIIHMFLSELKDILRCLEDDGIRAMFTDSKAQYQHSIRKVSMSRLKLYFFTYHNTGVAVWIPKGCGFHYAHSMKSLVFQVKSLPTKNCSVW